jgi:L-fuconolactonase
MEAPVHAGVIFKENTMHFSITDSHLHLWDNRNLNYPWLNQVPSLNQPFLLTELLEATKSLHVESFVFVQAGCDPAQALAEAIWVSDLARKDSRIHGIVAYAALETGNNVRAHLAALKNLTLVKGVRRNLQSDDVDFCLQPSFIEGVQALAEFDFSFDLSVYAHQLPIVSQLVQRCPQIKFVLDHMGKPNIAAKELKSWQDDIRTLAAFPNVWCKISGLVSEAQHHIWRSEDLKPYVYHAVNEFGFDRVMFGSDWPTINLASSYSHWAHTLHDLLSHASSDDLQKLFYDNAWRFYELEPEFAEA